MWGTPARWVPFAVLLAVVLGCGGSSSVGTARPELPPPSGVASLSVAQTAADLADPAKALDGVWSVTAHLNIGVFDAAGHEMLHGAQPIGDHNLYLYRFELDLLAREVADAPDTWSWFAQRLAASPLATTWSGDQLRAIFAAFLAGNAGAYSSQLLTAMKFDTAGAGALTSFEEWLLIVDGEILHASQMAAVQVAAAVGRPAAAVEPAVSLAAAYSVDQWLEVSHGIAVAALVGVQIGADPYDINMGIGGPGDTTTVIARFRIDATVPSLPGIYQGWVKRFHCTYSGTSYTDPTKLRVSWEAAGQERYISMLSYQNTPSPGGQVKATIQAQIDFFNVGQRKVIGIAVTARPDPASLAAYLPRCTWEGNSVLVGYFVHGGTALLNLHYHRVPTYQVRADVTQACPHGVIVGLHLQGELIPDKVQTVSGPSARRVTLSGRLAGTITESDPLTGAHSSAERGWMVGTVTDAGLEVFSTSAFIATGTAKFSVDGGSISLAGSIAGCGTGGQMAVTATPM